MAWNLLKDLPNSFGGTLPEIIGVLKTLWENVKRLNQIFQPTHYTSLITAGRTLANLVADIGSQTATLYVNSAVTVSANLTIPSNISIVVLKGGSFSISSGVTLTIDGGFSAGDYQVFSGDGYLNVVFATDSSVGVSLQWFGADGTGVADATAILQRFITRGWPIFDDGTRTYKTTTTLTVPNNTALRIYGQLRLRPNGAFDCITNGFSATAATTLSASIRAGATTFTVTSASGMNVGDLLVIQSTKQWHYNYDNATMVYGEMNKIAAISGTTITPALPINLEYDLGAYPGIAVATYTPQVVDIEGLEIIYSPSQSAKGLGFSYLDGASSRLNNITVQGANDYGISIGRSFGVVFNNPTLIENFMAGAGYGIGFAESTLCAVKGGTAYRNRHGVDFSGGVPCHCCLVTGMHITGNPTNPGSSCLGTHGPANKIAFIGNYLCDAIVGVDVRSPHTTVHDNVYWGMRSAFIVLTAAPSISVQGNTHRLDAAPWAVAYPLGIDPYFMEVGTDASGEDANLYFLENSQFVVKNNSACPTTAFIHLRSAITKMEYWTITDNVVNLQNPSSSNAISFLEAETACTINSSSTVHNNRIRALHGVYTELSNITRNSDSAETWPGVHTFSSGLAITGGSGAAGRLTWDSTNGLRVQPLDGASANDFHIRTPAGTIILRNPAGTNNWTMEGGVATGAVSAIGGAAIDNVALYLQGAITGGSDSQYGLLVQSILSSAATTRGIAAYHQLQTAAAAFTMASAHGIQIDSPSLGAGSAITTLYGLKIEDQTAGGTANYAIYTGAGAVRLGGAVSADSTLSIGGGTAIDKYEEGTFTGTLTGVTATVTGTLRYTRIGKIVTLYIPALTGTSNTTLCRITGLPASIVPASGRAQNIAAEGITDNGIEYAGIISVNEVAGNGQLELSYRTASNVAPTPTFTNSGTKGLSYEATITYTIQ